MEASNLRDDTKGRLFLVLPKFPIFMFAGGYFGRLHPFLPQWKAFPFFSPKATSPVVRVFFKAHENETPVLLSRLEELFLKKGSRSLVFLMLSQPKCRTDTYWEKKSELSLLCVATQMHFRCRCRQDRSALTVLPAIRVGSENTWLALP